MLNLKPPPRYQRLLPVVLLALALPGFAATPAFTLRQVVRLALNHNHTLQAEKTLIAQAQDDQITAGLRPNPDFNTDALFLPVFSPHTFNAHTLNTFSEFDAGASYTFELGGKRGARKRAASEQTAVVKSQVANQSRLLIYRVQRRFVQVLLAQSNLNFARRDLANFQQVVAISRRQYQAGSISHGNFLKTRLQTLTFQSDVMAAQIELTDAQLALRRLVGFATMPATFTLAGQLAYRPVQRGLTQLEAEALRQRPDIAAAKRAVAAAGGTLSLQRANAVPNLTTTLDYTHLGALNNLSAYATVGVPIFNRNQGKIARAGVRITAARQLEQAVDERALTSVRSAYAQAHSANRVVLLYAPQIASRKVSSAPPTPPPSAQHPSAPLATTQSPQGYLQIAQASLAISQYAYRRGAASLLDFLDAERSYRSVELAYRQALANAMIARARLEEAIASRSLP